MQQQYNQVIPTRLRARIPAALFLASLGLGAAQVNAMEVPGPLVDTEWLANHLDQVVVLDVRRDPQSFIRKASGGGEVGGIQACGASGGGGGVSGHIPDAALIDWKTIAVNQKQGEIELADMVPDAATFTKLMQDSGVNQDSAVVIANPGDTGATVADGTRLYWTLKLYGHDNVALLDGGVAKWAAEKRKIDFGRTKPKTGDWQAGPERQEIMASLSEVEAAVNGGDQILDVRTPEFYLGLRYKSDKVAAPGHIEGAKNLPFTLYIKESPEGSTFYSTDELRRVVNQLGISTNRPTISHCNTGHLSSSGWFVMHELLGNDNVAMYAGSMNEWAADPARPVSKDLQ